MTDEVFVLSVASELDDENAAGTDDASDSEYADKMLEMDAAREDEGSSTGGGGGDGPRTVLVWDCVSIFELALSSSGNDESSGSSGKTLW